ncbi:type IV secretion protein Rhs [Chryseobacterium indologenes]|uniref:RHS repeat-associated core domain-containing protein n=1 Tax=Chryseobacterium indologenes TaxID=253 RepID=UPI0011080F2B|nr:RHS repeat-associated core domain-containing protein [Chryseobacterium indologenes]TLX23684.1 type IV secretion protein Rhs [Chryseobacterium indologenes]
MKLILSFILSLCSILSFSQTILYQTESTSRTVQDPQIVILSQGFHAKAEASGVFNAKIGPATESSGGGPVDSGAGANNPTGTTTPQGQSFHDTKGNIEVTKAGQLQYTLTVDLPPGVQNVAPNISLTYVSGATNGLAGYGWNISGMSSISRIGKNLEKDGITKGVQLDYSDYYGFNGQRLILKSGEYGKDGAEYVTEKYSNIKIKSVGSISGQAWQGPEYWEVTFDDGSQAWYGAIAAGASPARTPIDYNIVKSKDISGNYITYKYVADGNVSVISSIEWGGNESQNTPHINKIDFTFIARPMPETAYIKGALLSQSKLLESIIVSTNNKQYKKYNVNYKTDGQKTDYRYLDKITVLNSKNEEANPVIFTYEKSYGPNSNGTYFEFDYNYQGILKLNSNTDVLGDFDGDGTLDLLRYHSQTSVKIPQTGVYLYKDFYQYDHESYIQAPIFTGNSLSMMNDAIAVNVKKNNLIHSRQSFVIMKQINNTSKPDLELSFYSITENNQLVLDFKKVIPNADYDNSDGGGQNGTTTTIIGIKSVDFNGDGLSEIVLQLNDRECWLIHPNDSAKLPHTCIDYGRSYVIDPDESISTDQWFYPLSLYKAGKEDVFTSYRAGDFNGDGMFDFLKIDQNKKPLLITFKKNLQGKYESSISPFIQDNNETIKGTWDDSLVGDYNGDGLSDIMMPTSDTSAFWYRYTSKGNGFKEEIIGFMRPQRDRLVLKDPDQSIKIYNPRTFVAYDINNDGKTDLISLESQRFLYRRPALDNSSGAGYKADNNYLINVFSIFGGQNSLLKINRGGYNYNLNNDNINSVIAVNSEDMIGIPVDLWTGAMLKRAVFASIGTVDRPYGTVQSTIASKYFDIAMEARINKISQAGITTEIIYKQLDKVKNPGLYDGAKTESYPYVEINQSTGMYVVSGMTQSTTSDKKLKQDFRYRGLTSNILGRGMIGFRKTARSSWYSDGFENTKVWSGLEIDPLNDGVPVKEWSIRTNTESEIFPADVSENNTQLVSFKSRVYQIDKLLNGQVVTTVSDADKAKVVTAIVPKTTKGKNFLNGITSESTMTYGQYYLPAQNVSKINTDYAVTTSSYEYNNNPSGSGSDYHIGRPTSKTEVIQAYGDTKSGKEEYTYESNLLKTWKTWNRDNSDYLLETYNYDGFGNIIQKIVSNSVDSQTQTAKTQYDYKGRFVLKKTDNLGLETEIAYNDWGQILTQTDPLGNILTNTYDNWGKLSTSKTNLGGTITYQYERDSNGNIIVTQNDPDGNISKKYTNKLGQIYKASTKAFGQGQLISTETQYDELGRKLKESEPYFEGQTANQWNINTYDDSVFPSKLTTIAFNGKQMETSVSGLTTTIKELNGYGRTTSKTADALGNIISSTDKGGTIQFSYNAAGKQTQAKYAENVVTTKYDSWGRKSEFNDPSNGVYKYEYDGFGQPKKITSPKGTKEYTYNALGQIVSQKEISTTDGGQATNKLISFYYDSKGRLTSKAGTSKGKAYSSNIAYDPQGRLLSSSESSNGKYFIQKGITYDDQTRIVSYEKQLYSSGVLNKVQIENVYSAWNGELTQVKDKVTGKSLWELKETNVKGQVLKAKLGSADISNTYDNNGFLTNINHSSSLKPSILQLSYSFDAIKNELKSRTTGGDFNITESFDYDDNNRLINWTNPVTGVKPQSNRNVYDIKGRILENDQIGKIKFDNFAKIYQPTGMTLNAAGIQNYNNDLIQSVSYNENNDPVFIDGEKGDVAFQYGLTAMRQQVMYGGNFGSDKQGQFTKSYSEDGSFEVIKNNATGQEKHILYIGGSPYESNIVYLKDLGQTSGSYKFLHKDYIGSILAISDENGKKLEQRHYDAWGNITHVKIGDGAIITDQAGILSEANNLILDRGYTSHEHFAAVGVIHMNGRLYDPLLRRFLNADENIQDPTNTQNYNKYGYVMNNPLMYNDPSGEFLMWLLGAFVGGYLNGVAANGGQWNPGKWNWESTWSAVLGGAIGGAAVSGALGNIASNAGAIKSFLPGIVSGGLNSAFNGGNFLGGAIGGITYNGTLFENKVTSAEMAAAKYIISPDYNLEGEGIYDLTPQMMGVYAHRAMADYFKNDRILQKNWFPERIQSIWKWDLKMRPDLYYMKNGINAVWELKPIGHFVESSLSMKGKYQNQVYADALTMLKHESFYVGSSQGAPRPFADGTIITDAISRYQFSYTIPVGTDGMIYYNCINCKNRQRDPVREPQPQTVNQTGTGLAVALLILNFLVRLIPN